MTDTTAFFKPKARIMELLGEQLIRSHVLALFELVKNSYDADATCVDIILLDVTNPNGEIEITDNGIGMSLNTVKTIWMEPGHSHKADSKSQGIRTEAGRLPIGEKGVGRFAVHRLGEKISMVTKTISDKEVVVEIDWKKFHGHDYLEDAPIQVYEREPEVFLEKKHGTRILISGLKQTWSRGQARNLKRSINGMTTTRIIEFKTDTKEKHNKADIFTVNLETYPDQNWFKDMFDPEAAKDQGMFFFDFSLTDKGLSYKYTFKPLAALAADYKGILSARPVEYSSENNEFFTKSHHLEASSWAKRKPRNKRPLLGKEPLKNVKKDIYLGIGPMQGRIIGFDLDKQIKARYIKDEANDLSNFLKDQGGIRVYRDHLRVYDYGEPGNDWLGLDHRRIQNPSLKISNQLMIGEVHLSLEESDGLHEKTNREGFIESKAYKELQYAMICILTAFEAERSKDKKRLRMALEIPPNPKQRKIKKNQTVEELLDDLKTVVLENNLGEELGDLVSNVSKAFVSARTTLLSATGAGLGLVTVFHELERGVRSLNTAIQQNTPLETLKAQSTELLGLLQGAMYMVSSSKMETITASRLVNLAVSTQERRFKRHNVKFLNGFKHSPDLDFELRGIRKMLVISLVNIIDNAIYWTDEVDSQSIIWIGPSLDLENPSIIIADNGDGIIDSPEDIIQPFFTRKSEGMGVGLYYVDWVMRSHSGRLAFPAIESIDIPKALDGAVIALTFKKGL